jgi:phenylalanyl-tRNA synthetase beta chain
MRIPLDWLRELVELDATPETLAERLTTAGLVVDAIEPVGRIDPRVVVGRIVAVEAHPQADRLQVCRVDAGGDEVVVVSGAPGLRAGRRVPLGRVGAALANGTTMQETELRGIRSEGMLCSEVELGLGEDASGVLELPADAAPGTAVAEMRGVADTVLVLDVTPNRADCLSLLGVARELAALTGARLRPLRVRLRESGAPARADVRVEIVAPDACASYCARVVRNVRLGTSPLEMRLRLRRAGMRPINTIVDATNYVMLERGQPLHAFDLARIAGGRIVVRRAAAGERFTTIDGIARTLEKSDLVIADGERPVALAGVMGGADSEVAEGTTTVLLESAFFAPATVRRTARRLGLLSQAAYRFERRVDPAQVEPALDAAAALIARLVRATVAPGVVEAEGDQRSLVPPAIRFRPARAASLLGVPVSKVEATRRLRALGAACSGDGAVLVVAPPSYRGDCASRGPSSRSRARRVRRDSGDADAAGAGATVRALARQPRALLVAEGLTEMVTVAFTDERTNAALPGVLRGTCRSRCESAVGPAAERLCRCRPGARDAPSARHGAPFVGVRDPKGSAPMHGARVAPRGRASSPAPGRSGAAQWTPRDSTKGIMTNVRGARGHEAPAPGPGATRFLHGKTARIVDRGRVLDRWGLIPDRAGLIFGDSFVSLTSEVGQARHRDPAG